MDTEYDIKTWKECAEKCFKNDECDIWSFKAEDKKCKLKKEEDGEKYRENQDKYVSGPKSCTGIIKGVHKLRKTFM